MLMLLFGMTACNNTPDTPEQQQSIQFVQSEITMIVGESAQAEITTAKQNVFVYWSTRDEGIATVTSKGMITAHSVGQTVCYAALGNETAMCLVTVKEKPANPELFVYVPYEDSKVAFYMGDSLALNTVVKFGDDVVTGASVSYEVADTNIATVADGKVYGAAVGKTTITITATYNGQTATALVSVQVVMPEKDVQAVSVSGQKTSFTVGEKFSFGGSVRIEYVDGTIEENAEFYSVDYQNYNPAKLGTYEITVMVGGKTATYSVTVQKHTGTFNVLLIGNSFSQDTMMWLPNIAKDVGFSNITIGGLVLGGCTIETHYNNMQSNTAAYDFTFYRNGTWTDGAQGTMRTLEYGLKYTNWDYIVLQQQSGNSGNVASYNYQLDALVDYVRATSANKNAKLVWNMTWAYPTGSDWFGGLYDNDQMKMYNSIVAAVQAKIVPNEEFTLISPAGTAIQNARTSFMGDGFVNNVNATDTLNRDGAHLSQYEGRFMSSLTMFCTITGYMPSDITFNATNVDEKEAAMIRECVTNALNTPFAVTQSQYKTK